MGTWNDLLRRPASRKLSVWFPPERIEAPDYAPKAVIANRGYFQVRLAEMFLRYERELWRGFLPATLFLCEFKQPQGAARVPFFVSNKLVSGLELSNGLAKTPIQFRDTRIVGPVPYLGDEVALLVALFRIQVDDWRKSLFSMIEKVLGVVNVGGIAQYAAIADKLSDDILKCLGMAEVECRLAERRVFGDASAPTLVDGYLALLDCPESDTGVRDALKVIEGRLHDTRSGKPLPFTECDYCLVRLEQLDTRSDYTSLPFHKIWEKAREQLVRSQTEEARTLLIECARQVLESPELTEEHRYQLVQIYTANFQRDEAIFAALTSKRATMPTNATRGAGTGGTVALLGKLRSRARERSAPKAGIAGLREIEQLWPEIAPHIADESVRSLNKATFIEQMRLDEAELARQLRGLSTAGHAEDRDTAALVRTLSTALVVSD
jgi:hypothetical protein